MKFPLSNSISELFVVEAMNESFSSCFWSKTDLLFFACFPPAYLENRSFVVIFLQKFTKWTKNNIKVGTPNKTKIVKLITIPSMKNMSYNTFGIPFK